MHNAPPVVRAQPAVNVVGALHTAASLASLSPASLVVSAATSAGVASTLASGAASIATSAPASTGASPGGQSAGSQFQRNVEPHADGPEAHLPAPSPNEHQPHPRTGVQLPHVVNDEHDEGVEWRDPW